MKKKAIGIIVGSLREESYSKKVANVIANLMPEDFIIHFVDIGNLPIYNQDLDDKGITPEEWCSFREKANKIDAYLFVTPEYNRSVPPVLKNALDVGSRPYGSSCWGGKPGGIISVSIGKIGGFGANHHLRQIMTFLDIPVMQQPEAYIGDISSYFDQNGNLADENTKSFLQEYANSFAAWLNKF